MIELQLFAEEQGEEKREDPTPRKRRKAREQGQVFHSKEVVSAILLLSVFLVLSFLLPSWAEDMQGLAIISFTQQLNAELGSAEVYDIFSTLLMRILTMLGPIFLVVLAVGAGGTLVQTGMTISTKPLNPDLKRIDPIEGIKRIFSMRALVNMVKSLMKVVAVGWVAYDTISEQISEFPMFLRYPLPHALSMTAELLQSLMLRAVVVLAAIAVLDYFYERSEHEKQLKMTRRELKEEMKETEGDPQIQSRRRSFRDQLARRRMMSEVPRSDVVVTNPTHYAVALRYEFGEMEAPVVIAKGRGLIAKRIIELANQHSVVVRREPPLARALYDNAEVDEVIPPHLYQAVAEVLAYVWRQKNSNSSGEG